MTVLVIGATGLIGGHVLRALRAAGCAAAGASRRRPAGERADDWLELDLGTMTRERDWLPLLDGVDAVVNCVGIIREARGDDFDRLHRAAPVALFAACERLGVRHVVQVSALGSHPEAATGYWRSKGAADACRRWRSAWSIYWLYAIATHRPSNRTSDFCGTSRPAGTGAMVMPRRPVFRWRVAMFV